MKKKAHARAKAPKKAPAFRPHPDDVADLRAAVASADRGEALPQNEAYALLDEMLGEPFPRPAK